MSGNFLIGMSVIAPAGMVEPLATDLGVSITSAALLLTFGAVVLCIGSPLVAWGTAATDRRLLLSVSLAVLAASHVASALAPGLAVLMAVRIVAMGFAAVYTPQAASAAAMLVSEKERSGAISFIFLGWSLAAAAGLPLSAWFASEHSWRGVHWALAALGFAAAGAVALSLPQGLRGAPMSLRSWGSLFSNPLILALLAATILGSLGQFIVFPFFGPLLGRLSGATTTEVAVAFGVFGVAGFLGNIVASRLVTGLGALRTSLLAGSSMLVGAAAWSLVVGDIALVFVASAIWGVGFAASNSMQQARLAMAAPALAGAAVALNSSSLYIGQAAGSALGGVMFDAGYLRSMGWAATAALAAALLTIWFSRRTTQ
ncbi:MAG: MFS transporter [Rhizobiaceae bacterium]|nr:MFS transporter [Rhizobiaceae bacterium]